MKITMRHTVEDSSPVGCVIVVLRFFCAYFVSVSGVWMILFQLQSFGEAVHTPAIIVAVVFGGRFLKGFFLVACQRVDYLFTVCMYCPIAGLGHTGTSIIARMFQGSAWR